MEGGNIPVKCQTCYISGYQWKHLDNLGGCFVVTWLGMLQAFVSRGHSIETSATSRTVPLCKELSRTLLNCKMSYKWNTCLYIWAWNQTLFYVKQKVFSHQFHTHWTLQQMCESRKNCTLFCSEISKGSSPCWKISRWCCWWYWVISKAVFVAPTFTVILSLCAFTQVCLFNPYFKCQKGRNFWLNIFLLLWDPIYPLQLHMRNWILHWDC